MKRLILIVSYLVVALVFTFFGYLISNPTQSLKVDDIAFATVTNEEGGKDVIKVNALEAQEIFKKLNTLKENQNTLDMVLPIRVRIYDTSGAEVYTFVTAVDNNKVIPEIRSKRRSYSTDKEFTSFLEQLFNKYNIF
ncbi:MAG: hypothetical protein ACOYWZ_18180 [Bacillota bacterium]